MTPVEFTFNYYPTDSAQVEFHGFHGPSRLISEAFVKRLVQFAEYERGWDGGDAEPVSLNVVTRALQLAVEAKSVLPSEPFVGPSADGSILLRWHLDGKKVELFVDESDDLESLALISDDEVREIPVRSDRDVIVFLGDLTGLRVGAGAGIRV